MSKKYKILVLNPGSTSTKIALFEDEQEIFVTTKRHLKEELDGFDTINDQKDMRRNTIDELLVQNKIDLSGLDAVVGRGGLVKPIEGGTYIVNENMLRDLKSTAVAQHASSLGGILAAEISADLHIPAYVVDPVVVDEMDRRAKLSGLPGIERESIFHALNQKAVARRYAKEIGRAYEDLRLIVAHMGGGISVGAHRYGRVTDVNDGLDGEGPFSPERTGGMPVGQLVRMCFSGMYTEKEMMELITKKGGMQAYINTNDVSECERLIKEGNDQAALVLESMAYQVAKEIGAMAAVLEGRIDAILLTGGIAYSDRFLSWIREQVAFLAPIKVYPGEDEMKALAEGTLRVLRGIELPKEY